MTQTNTTPARVGRERFCVQCGTSYRSPRNSSRYCSPACRKKAHRGTAPKGGPRSGPEAFSIIGKLLIRGGFVGLISPTSRRSTEPAIHALLVDCDLAYAELASLFDWKGWGILTREEFSAALRRDGIRPYSTASSEAVERNRWQSRQRTRRARS